MGWSKSTRITMMLVIDVIFLILELGVGIWVGSLALMADAFHMLNDIISLAVGLWAVQAAQRSKTDKYTFGWLRAEILGAFFNATFLIALCLSIVLEAIGRLIDPPEISQPVLILIVGSCGLVSNLAGFFILGGHGHSHGSGDEHSHAEEGHAHSHSHKHADADSIADEDTHPGTVFPEAVVANARASPDPNRHIRPSTSKTSDLASGRTSRSRRHRRRSSIKNGRLSSLSNIEDLSIHPASFRQEIIAASRPQLEGIQSEGSGDDEEAIVDPEGATETSPLIGKNKANGSHDHDHDHDDHDHEYQHAPSRRKRHDSWHVEHNHNKPAKKSSSSHGHNHDDMGMRAMVLHVIGDALGNVGVIITALIIWLTDWPGKYYADPAVSLFITLIILRSTIPLTVATAKILLQATPDHLIVEDIKADLEDIPGIVSCHHVHIWQLSDTQIVASMHIRVAFPITEEGGTERYMEVTRQAKKCLHAYGIHSATIQPEFQVGDFKGGLDGVDEEGDDERGLAKDRARAGSNACLLGCVDDCENEGCCVGPSGVEGEDDHDHGDEEHGRHH